jgi:hypothetical protein
MQMRKNMTQNLMFIYAFIIFLSLLVIVTNGDGGGMPFFRPFSKF